MHDTKHPCRRGVWTPSARVLCVPCHGPELRDGSMIPHAAYMAAVNELCELDYTPPRCDGCGMGVSTGHGDVDALASLRDRVNARTPGAARMDQTGGMCAALEVRRADGCVLTFTEDEESWPLDAYAACVYPAGADPAEPESCAGTWYAPCPDSAFTLAADFLAGNVNPQKAAAV